MLAMNNALLTAGHNLQHGKSKRGRGYNLGKNLGGMIMGREEERVEQRTEHEFTTVACFCTPVMTHLPLHDLYTLAAYLVDKVHSFHL